MDDAIGNLSWPQFIELLERLEMDSRQFAESDTSNERIVRFRNQVRLYLTHKRK